MPHKMITKIFPPGEFVREELEARGWTQVDLAEIMARPHRLVNELIAGKRSITPDTAQALGQAFGTGAQYWLNLEMLYQLHKSKAPDEAIARRARLYRKVPVKDLLKRRWIEASPDIEVLEKRVCEFLGIGNLDEEPIVWPHAARKKTSYNTITPAQIAWLCRARHLAQTIPAKQFTDERFERALQKIHDLLSDPECARKVPDVLAEAGIRFVVVAHLPQTRIDGACLWLDEVSPVIAISARYDRIDWFWFSVLHEMKHIKNRDGLNAYKPFDIDLVGDKAIKSEEKPEVEKDADTFAASFLVPRIELKRFISRVKPQYSKVKIQLFADEIGVHPGIVVGQLQFQGEIQYYHNREMLVKIRDIITSAALTDGWGHVPTLQ